MLIWLVAWPSLALSGTCGEYDEASFILETKTLPSTESSGLAAARTRPGCSLRTTIQVLSRNCFPSHWMAHWRKCTQYWGQKPPIGRIWRPPLARRIFDNHTSNIVSISAISATTHGIGPISKCMSSPSLRKMNPQWCWKPGIYSTHRPPKTRRPSSFIREPNKSPLSPKVHLARWVFTHRRPQKTPNPWS